VVASQADGEQASTKRRRSSGNVACIEFNLGNADKLSKGEVVKLVRGDTDLTGRDIGKITLGDRYTHVDVFKKDADKVIASLCEQVYKGKAVRARMV